MTLQGFHLSPAQCSLHDQQPPALTRFGMCCCVCLQVFDQSTQEFIPVKELPSLYVTAQPKRWKVWKWVRDKVLRLWSRLFSRKPRITPAQALQRMEQLGLKGLKQQQH